MMHQFFNPKALLIQFDVGVEGIELITSMVTTNTLISYFEHAYPNHNKEPIRISIKDKEFIKKDLCLAMACPLYAYLLNEGSELEKILSLKPNYLDDVIQFFSERTDEMVARVSGIAKLSSKKAPKKLDEILNYIDSASLGLYKIIFDLDQRNDHQEFRQKVYKIGKNLIKRTITEISTLDNVNHEFKDKVINELNIRLGDFYSLMCGQLFNDADPNNSIRSLHYLIKVESLYNYTHKNAPTRQGVQFQINSYFCILCIRIGNIEKAEQYANCLLNKEEVEILPVLKKIPPCDIYTQLGDAFFKAGKYTKARRWYQRAIDQEKVKEQKIIRQKKISEITSKYASLGHECYKAQNYTGASKWFTKAVRYEADNKIKTKYQCLLTMTQNKESELYHKQKQDIVECVKRFTNIAITFNDTEKSIVITYANEKRKISRPVMSNMSELEKLFEQLNEFKIETPAIADIKPLAAATQLTNNDTIVPIEKNTEKKKTRKNNDPDNNNNTNNEDPIPDRDNEVDPHELFGKDCEGRVVYPLNSSYLGRTVHFSLFSPPTSGLGAKLSDTTIEQHRSCLENGMFGPDKRVRQTPTGFKTWISSNSQAGNIRFVSCGDIAVVVRNGVTYHLVDFNRVFDHKSQDIIYKK